REARGDYAHPRIAGHIGDGVAAHRTHHQDAFQAEVDAAALLGNALAEADEEERGTHAQRAAEHRDRYAPPAEFGHAAVLPSISFGRNIAKRPYSASLARIMMNAMPC